MGGCLPGGGGVHTCSCSTAGPTDEVGRGPWLGMTYDAYKGATSIAPYKALREDARPRRFISRSERLTSARSARSLFSAAVLNQPPNQHPRAHQPANRVGAGLSSARPCPRVRTEGSSYPPRGAQALRERSLTIRDLQKRTSRWREPGGLPRAQHALESGKGPVARTLNRHLQ